MWAGSEVAGPGGHEFVTQATWQLLTWPMSTVLGEHSRDLQGLPRSSLFVTSSGSVSVVSVYWLLAAHGLSLPACSSCLLSAPGGFVRSAERLSSGRSHGLLVGVVERLSVAAPVVCCLWHQRGCGVQYQQVGSRTAGFPWGRGTLCPVASQSCWLTARESLWP